MITAEIARKLTGHVPDSKEYVFLDYDYFEREVRQACQEGKRMITLGYKLPFADRVQLTSLGFHTKCRVIMGPTSGKDITEVSW